MSSTYATNELRKGLRIEFEGNLYKVVEVNFVKPGKGTAFYRTKMKGLLSGSVIERNLRSGVKVGAPDIEDRTMTYLYSDGENACFMDSTNYEQLEIPLETIGNDVNWLVDNMEIEVMIHNGRALDITLPNFVELEITECAPGVKGDTATNTTKPATMSTGAIVNVPLFVNEGDWIKIDTRTSSYASRVSR